MKIIVGDRGTGRTTELIKESARTGARIVCLSNSVINEIVNRAIQLKYNIKTPIIYSKCSLYHNDNFLFDDINFLISNYFNVDINRIEGISIYTDKQSTIKNLNISSTTKFKIGDKVIPIKKSTSGPLSDSVVWKQAQNNNQSFLYVNDIENNKFDDHNNKCVRYTCHIGIAENSFDLGDFFSEDDLILYTQEENKKDLISKSGFKIGDKVHIIDKTPVLHYIDYKLRASDYLVGTDFSIDEFILYDNKLYVRQLGMFSFVCIDSIKKINNNFICIDNILFEIKKDYQDINNTIISYKDSNNNIYNDTLGKIKAILSVHKKIANERLFNSLHLSWSLFDVKFMSFEEIKIGCKEFCVSDLYKLIKQIDNNFNI